MLHLDILKIFLHAEVSVLDDENKVANLVDQLWMSRWVSNMTLKLPQELDL